MHQSVLLNEAIDALITDPQACYIDATFGRGGHTKAILEKLQPPGQVLVVDKDPEAIALAQDWQRQGLPVIAVHGSFADLEKHIATHQLNNIQGVLFDLGVSSPQLDQAQRGFSFMKEGPLDMRMDTTQGMSAAQWLAKVKEAELAKVIKEYGEERFAKRIAAGICLARKTSPIETTGQLASIIKEAIPFTEKHKHPATRTFQAIRIFINRELADLEQGLVQALGGLNVGGRMVVISFHSLEDRIVKQWMQVQAKGDPLPASIPILAKDICPSVKIIGKAVAPGIAELKENPRARSARMRVAEKIKEE